MDDERLTLSEAAVELDRTYRHVRRMIAEGKLHAERVSNEPGVVHFRIARSEIERVRPYQRKLKAKAVPAGFQPQTKNGDGPT